MVKASKILNKNIPFDHKVNKLCNYSKDVEMNDIFFAFKGSKTNGNFYVEEAIKKGAKTVVTEENSILYNNINIVVVKDVGKYLGECCKRYYKDISKHIKLIGITGTNGKTTTATLCYKYIRFLNKNAALISTNGIYINDKYYENNNTTPDIIKIYDVLTKAKEEGCEIVIMEVSSHSVKLNRIYGLRFEVGALTNITHDHLDFHKTIVDYKLSKLMFLSKAKYPIINDLNDDFLPYLNNNAITFGISKYDKKPDYIIKNINESLEGLEFQLLINKNCVSIRTKMLSEINAYNISLFVIIIKTIKLFEKKSIDVFLHSEVDVAGRLEIINKNPKIIVDFAHTPDAVNRVLNFFNKYKNEGKLITVIGTGGNRDKEKRKEIGKICSTLSDVVIFTEDNSRNENIEDIVSDIILEIKNNNYIIIYNRLMAIEKALEIASPSDIVCVLGRGAEEYLEINDVLIPFNDKNEILKLIYKYYQ